MLTGAEYLTSMKDGRQLYVDGALVEDPVNHPLLASAYKFVASTYDKMWDPNKAVGPYYTIPQDVGELRTLMEGVSDWDDLASVTASGLMALVTTAARMPADDPAYAPYIERIKEFHRYCVENDLRCVQAITDAKGDRQLPPSRQADPDSYTRIVERRPDGIVINGAKLHITGAAMAHEMIVMPTKRMKADESDWAVACAVPVNAEGVKIVNTTFAPRGEQQDYWPVSSVHNLAEGFIIFDNVFVPNERVFLAGEVEHSATFAHALGLWERVSGGMHMADAADTLVGFAQLIAEANGVAKIAHIKDKIAEMVITATLIRGGLEAAIANAETTPEGWVHPNELYTNAVKHYGGAQWTLMCRHLHDIAGGAVLTAPTPDDLANSEVGPLLHKYMVGRDGVDADYRSRLFHAIRDYTADALGGWWYVTLLQSGGGLFAQRMVSVKHYPMAGAKRLALRTAHFSDETVAGVQ
ncbi:MULTISPECIES: 4-hydroxyphenylacetate 3-hydroxylase N-terminal domain-containing protein [unclassified Mycobacterium]|uniref:4-hydroxyphenylacetate 3-hydroxylase N-terminal domain-containing protein n=1 Tax=unclassified Mycobacterium TaxID=2642494 RepID=UPI0029C8CF9C|nr:MULTISPECIES: 4-hydroxyphenylacetate 3-hydroxylase N-terminal domain-containing protein [unclassified Mycobacterium]